ncbi:hypothetical protein [Paenibacillus rigui]|uniref:DNA ligase (ATP) n=1 Tax=Paenibacillus rigui TaxID=554312 RepID=A0A229UM27_9BACL|nr:hypothetical protein [Paenibacillus rigui]OXM84460.1 DNA ligase [Paenibacillus rigui]
MTIELPSHPMAPISVDSLPVGSEWGYQLKWDGVRLLTRIRDGRIELFSRQLLNKTTLYPEAIASLEPLRHETCLLDGEAVMFDAGKQRPDFSLILQRERSRTLTASREDRYFVYVLFDLLHWHGEDLRGYPYEERHRRLQELFPEKRPQLFVTDLFPDGEALWRWVDQNSWEGVVAKRLSSPYREGKKHKDWFKKKTALLLEVQIVGLLIRGGQVASLIMEKNGSLFGRVSLGLDEKRKAQLLQAGRRRMRDKAWFSPLPPEWRKEQIVWLDPPFRCTVTGLEITAAGQLRHPKIVDLRTEDLESGE